ncbi:MAG TPA: TldD/PmbA family protein [Candidatus Caccosoma faecigallinarum]|uniref:TldD/PmbA family protein n=1 Tax=Candidatus Caccosoma faecigallinarum TaxID=2840720 RepID=A0A9D1G7L4_9FIRM|nr:TldD/PmbA family protein [Candidatus Caccosoma faecigallinarum]
MESFSTYLSQSKPLLQKLIQMLSAKYTYVSILACDSVGKFIEVSEKEQKIIDHPLQERGFVVRVYNGKYYSEYSFNHLEAGNIKDTFNQIVEQLDVKDAIDKSIYLKETNYPLIQEQAMKESFSKLNKDKKYTLQELIHFCKKMVDHTFEESEYVIHSSCRIEYLTISKMFLSSKKELEQVYFWANGRLSVILNRNDITKTNFESASDVTITGVLKELDKKAHGLIKDGRALLDSEKPSAGEYDIITTPDITGIIAHEAFGHGVEMDMFVKNRAKAQQYLGKRVASEIINMHDGAIPFENSSSYFFDDEGILAQDTLIIKNGILQTGIADTLSALKLNITPTGNGKRESYKRKAYTRMTTTYFERGKSNLDDMIATIKKGILVSNAYSGMEDPKNWGMQAIALIGKEIVDGKVTSKVFSPIYMSGNVLDILQSASLTSHDFELFGSGYCCKGYKEKVKTVDGGPYLKVKVNIG